MLEKAGSKFFTRHRDCAIGCISCRPASNAPSSSDRSSRKLTDPTTVLQYSLAGISSISCQASHLLSPVSMHQFDVPKRDNFDRRTLKNVLALNSTAAMLSIQFPLRS